MTKLSVEIPFSGFYEPHHSAAFDDYIERETEYLREEKGAGEEAIETLQNLYCDSDFAAMRLDYAKEYTAAFAHFIKEEGNHDIGLEFEELKSPREYNFTTDRIFAKIQLVDITYMAARVGRDVLKAKALDTFTSRDGFISFYDNDLDNWPLGYTEWDHNQLSIILECYVEHITNEPINDTIDDCYGIMESFSSNGGIDETIFKHVTPEFKAFYETLVTREAT